MFAHTCQRGHIAFRGPANAGGRKYGLSLADQNACFLLRLVQCLL